MGLERNQQEKKKNFIRWAKSSKMKTCPAKGSLLGNRSRKIPKKQQRSPSLHFFEDVVISGA